MFSVNVVTSQCPGYSAEKKKESLDAYEFSNGSEWQRLILEKGSSRPKV